MQNSNLQRQIVHALYLLPATWRTNHAGNPPMICGQKQSPFSARKLLIVINMDQFKSILPGTLQEAHLQQMIRHANKVKNNIKELTEDVENYATILAAGIKHTGNYQTDEDLAGKIVKEGKRVGKIVLEQGAMITEIVEQLTSIRER